MRLSSTLATWEKAIKAEVGVDFHCITAVQNGKGTQPLVSAPGLKIAILFEALARLEPADLSIKLVSSTTEFTVQNQGGTISYGESQLVTGHRRAPMPVPQQSGTMYDLLIA